MFEDRLTYAKAHTKILYLSEAEHRSLARELTNIRRVTVERYFNCAVSISDKLAARQDKQAKDAKS